MCTELKAKTRPMHNSENLNQCSFLKFGRFFSICVLAFVNWNKCCCFLFCFVFFFSHQIIGSIGQVIEVLSDQSGLDVEFRETQ